MAGIGFLLKKMVKEERYLTDIKAGLYALVISSGPWLFAVICIAGLSVFSHPFLDKPEMALFRAIIVYTYAFSLISTSFFQLVLTRFISDRLYQREYDALLPNFMGVMFISGILNFILSVSFIYFTTLDFIMKILCVILFCVVGFQWIIMVFLSSIRDYIKVTKIYFSGFILSFLAAIMLGYYLELPGFLLGYIIGQVFVVLLMIQRIAMEFPFGKNNPFEFMHYFKIYPQLALAAFLYNLGFWIDKIIIWHSPFGKRIAHLFYYQYPYDTAMFLAILTIIPAMSIFFLQVETDFYEGLRHYINVILNKGTFEDIDIKRKNLIHRLKIKIKEIVQVQFLITIILFLLAPVIIPALGFSGNNLTEMFMIFLFSAFFQVLFLILIVVFWYLELLNESLACVAVYAGLNAGLNLYFVYYTPFILGLGYFLATLLSFVFTAVLLYSRLKRLNYITFLKRPLPDSISPMPLFDQ